MKIAILQLADLHCQDNSNMLNLIFKNISDILLNISFDKLYLCVCGDLINKGKHEYFNIVVKTINEFEKEFKQSVKIFCVPGNHDIVYDECDKFNIENNNQLEKYMFAMKDLVSVDDNGCNFISDNDISICLLILAMGA